MNETEIRYVDKWHAFGAAVMKANHARHAEIAMFYALGVPAKQLMSEYGIGKARFYTILKLAANRSRRRLDAMRARRWSGTSHHSANSGIA
jgi:hypothetical protein